MQREPPAGGARFFGSVTCGCAGVVRQSGQLILLGDADRIRIGGIKRMIGEFFGSRRLTFLQRGKARLFRVVEFSAREPEIAQRVQNHLPARLRKCVKGAAFSNRLVLLIERPVLSDNGPKARDEGVSAAAFKWPTTPHARASGWVARSAGCTTSSQVAGVSGAHARSMAAAASASSASSAGVICSARISSKRGRSEKSSRGLEEVIAQAEI